MDNNINNFWVLLAQKEFETADILAAVREAIRLVKEDGEMAATVAIEHPDNPLEADVIWWVYQDDDVSWFYTGECIPGKIRKYL